MVEKYTYATTYTPEIALADGTYYWRVQALVGTTWEAYVNARTFNKDWSGGGTIVPQLLSPAEGGVRAAFSSLDFSWSAVDGAATYRLEISTDPGFNSTAYTATTLRPQHTPKFRLPNNLYYWRVIPIDSKGNWGCQAPRAALPSIGPSRRSSWRRRTRST